MHYYARVYVRNGVLDVISATSINLPCRIDMFVRKKMYKCIDETYFNMPGCLVSDSEFTMKDGFEREWTYDYGLRNKVTVYFDL